MKKRLKYYWYNLLWPALVSYVVAVLYWVSNFWYFKEDNIEKAIITLGVGIFLFLSVDIPRRRSLSKETET